MCNTTAIAVTFRVLFDFPSGSQCKVRVETSAIVRATRAQHGVYILHISLTPRLHFKQFLSEAPVKKFTVSIKISTYRQVGLTSGIQPGSAGLHDGRTNDKDLHRLLGIAQFATNSNGSSRSAHARCIMVLLPPCRQRERRRSAGQARVAGLRLHGS